MKVSFSSNLGFCCAEATAKRQKRTATTNAHRFFILTSDRKQRRMNAAPGIVESLGLIRRHHTKVGLKSTMIRGKCGATCPGCADTSPVAILIITITWTAFGSIQVCSPLAPEERNVYRTPLKNMD
jgi:hypothetical protein